MANMTLKIELDESTADSLEHLATTYGADGIAALLQAAATDRTDHSARPSTRSSSTRKT